MSDIGNPITGIENEAWVEAVARALCKLKCVDPDELRHNDLTEELRPMWIYFDVEARAAIRALAPLIIERCAEVVANSHKALPYDGIDTDYETGIVDAITEAVAALRALNHSGDANEMVGAPAKEADHA